KFKFKPPANVPSQLKLPDEIPDLDSSFGLGGSGGNKLLDELNEALNAFIQSLGLQGIQAVQGEDGVLDIVDTMSSPGTIVLLTYMIDGERLIQAGASATPGLFIVPESGQINFITPNRKQIALVPAPRDPVELLPLLGAGGDVSIGAGGDVRLRIVDNNGQVTQLVVLFDPTILPATGQQPGVFISNPNARGGTPVGQVVFNDGTAQQIFPYIPEPDTFIATALSLSPEIDSVFLNLLDGTATAVVAEVPLQLVPASTALVRTLSGSETVSPSILLNADFTLSYTVQEINNELLTTLNILP
ncbi:MAG: hypothetical protein AAF512_22310, partial [Pseudomonadota bacterium]